MAVYSYSRFTEIEALEAPHGLESLLLNEKLALHTYALSKRISISNNFEDRSCRFTANFANRAQGALLMNSLKPRDMIICHSLERIFSTSQDTLNTINILKKMRVKLFIINLGGDITDNKFSPPFSAMIGIFKNLEKRRATERIKTVKQIQRKKGRFLGGSRPFGYMIHSNGRLLENPMEQRVLKKIIEMKSQGKSLRAISSAVSTPIMPVSFKTVHRLLKRHDSNYSMANSVAP